MNTSTECDIDPSGEICRCGGRMMQRTCPTCDDQKEYCETCGETEMEQQHAQEVEQLKTRIENLNHEVLAFEVLHNSAVNERDALRATLDHDTDMLGTLLASAEKDARYHHGAVLARNAYAWGNRHQPWLAHMCPWCQLENGQHTNECPEKQWPSRPLRRRERTGRPLRLLLTIPNIPVGVKTCRGDGWECPALCELQTCWSCSIAVLAQWDGGQEWLRETGGCDSQPIRCDGCINAEE